MNKLKSRIAGLGVASVTAIVAAVSLGGNPDTQVASQPAAPTPYSAKAADDKHPKVPVPKTFRPINNDCSGGYVYLTFDDGPNAYTDELLDRLKALNLNATFFVLGESIGGREDVVRRTVAEGNRVENHSWNHVNMVTGKNSSGKQVSPWGPAEVRDQIRQTNARINEVTGKTPVAFRPPFGSMNKETDAISLSEGMAVDDPNRKNSITSEDYDGLGSAAIVKRLKSEGIVKNAVVVQHDGLIKETFETIGAMQGIVDEMNKQKLCSSTNFKIKNGVMVP